MKGRTSYTPRNMHNFNHGLRLQTPTPDKVAFIRKPQKRLHFLGFSYCVPHRFSQTLRAHPRRLAPTHPKNQHLHKAAPTPCKYLPTQQAAGALPRAL